jgi:hypothetical protein
MRIGWEKKEVQKMTSVWFDLSANFRNESFLSEKCGKMRNFWRGELILRKLEGNKGFWRKNIEKWEFYE